MVAHDIPLHIYIVKNRSKFQIFRDHEFRQKVKFPPENDDNIV